MAKGDFYFPLYYKRLLSSTVGWSDAEFGCYLKLLIHQFDNGSIPEDLSELARIAPTVKKHWKLIGPKFKSNGNGGLINEVMDDIYQSIQTKKKRNQENGANGGRPVAVKPGQIRLYLLHCTGNGESFYKIGVTDQTIKKRYASSAGNSRSMPYSYTIVFDQILAFELGIFVEETVLKECEKYVPKVPFGGHKECLLIRDNVLKTITDIITQKNPIGFNSVTETKAIPILNSKESITKERDPAQIFYSIEHCLIVALADERWVRANKTSEVELKEFNAMLEKRAIYEKNPADYKSHFANWKKSGKREDEVADAPAQTGGVVISHREQKGLDIMNQVNG